MHLKGSFSYGGSQRRLLETAVTSATECHVSVLLKLFKIKEDWGWEE